MSSKRKTAAVFPIILILVATSVFAENIDMFVGEVKVLGQVEVDRVAVGNGQTLRAEVLNSGELLVIAQDKGSSSLRLWNKDGSQTSYNIRVSGNDPEQRVRMEDMVRMRVKMVEFRKAALGELGISWGSNINGPAFSVAGDFITSNLFRSPGDGGIGTNLPLSIDPFSAHFGIATSIASRINYLASTGDAVTLAEPTLSCINGGSASFLAGGEIPYPVVGINGQVNVEFKEYGIKLEVSPRVDASGNIYTKILTEISQIDPATTVLDVPGLVTRRTQTEMNVVAGQTMVISGLMSAESSKDIDKVAGLGELPILGALFRSKNYRNQLSELVIFVTPEVQKPGNTAIDVKEQVFLDRRRDKLNEMGKKLKYEIME